MKNLIVILILCFFNTIVKAQDPRLVENDWFFANGTVNSVDFLPLSYLHGELFFTESTMEVAHNFCEEGFESNIILIDENSFELDIVLVILPGTCSNGIELDFMDLHYTFYGDYSGTGNPNNSFEYLIEEVGDDLRLTITNGNGDIAVYNNVLLNTASFETQEIAIYPNPVAASLFVATELPITAWSVYNVLGEQVLSGKELEASISVASLNQGVYFIELQMGNNKLIKQFVKQ